MHLAYNKVKALIPALNERPLTVEDFWFTTYQYDADVFHLDLNNNGYFVHDEGIDYIFLKKTLREILWLETAIHEMFHLILHHPEENIHAKQQKEAEALALIAMFPRTQLDELAIDSHSMEPRIFELFVKRMEIYKTYGL
jgi:hypothetical protein